MKFKHKKKNIILKAHSTPDVTKILHRVVAMGPISIMLVNWLILVFYWPAAVNQLMSIHRYDIQPIQLFL